MATRLAGLPTSEAEDRALLDAEAGEAMWAAGQGGAASRRGPSRARTGALLTCPRCRPWPADWRMRSILQFRVSRKRALRQVLDRMAAAGCREREPAAAAAAAAVEGAQEAAGAAEPRDEL